MFIGLYPSFLDFSGIIVFHDVHGLVFLSYDTAKNLLKSIVKSSLFYNITSTVTAYSSSNSSHYNYYSLFRNEDRSEDFLKGFAHLTLLIDPRPIFCKFSTVYYDGIYPLSLYLIGEQGSQIQMF